MKDANKKSLSPQSLQEAMTHYKSGRPLVAEEMYRKILLDEPQNVTCLHMLGIMASESGRHDEAVALLGQAVRIKKNDPLLLFTLGMTLQKAGKPEEALLKFKTAVSLKPDYAEAHTRIGDILKNQEKFDAAELKYKRVIALKADHVAAHYCLGQVLKKQDKLDEAVLAYRQTIALKPDHAEACNNLGVIFNEQKKYDDAIKVYEQALSIKPDYAAAKDNLNAAQDNLHAALRKSGLIDEAIGQCEQTLAREPDNQRSLTALVDFIHHGCVWEKMDRYESRMLDMAHQKHGEISPFVFLTTPATAEDQLACARSFTAGKEQPQQALFTHTPQKSAAKKPEDRIKIGYFSSDFYHHAMAHLIAGLFERHDRSRFDVTAYSYGPGDKSPMRKRLLKAFDDFVDIDDCTDREAAQKIYDDGTDILVDLTGVMNHARLGISACRPAPIQVNYLGYPGTMGASFIDYIIADRFIIPENQEKFYSEKVVCLPDTYQPNDTARKIAETAPTRQECGLPEQGFVFCCFNGAYKIRPPAFDIWMRLLRKAPGSVLWLLESNQPVKGNLKREAERRGVNPERIIFAPSRSLPEHLARHRLADLFLDTLPVNAHTTTSDALWAGLPVLSCVGTTFAGRVAGSLLKAAELPELITYSLEDYEALALHLAQNPARLAEIRRKLERTRLQAPLFDIEKFTINIEKSYQTMFDIWQAGESPKGFTVLGE